MAKPESVNALLDAGVAEQQAGRTAQARRLFEKALRTDPRNSGALHLLSILHLQDGAFEQGLQLIRRNIAYHPDDGGAYNNLGNALSWAGRPAEAVEAYTRSIDLRPGHPSAYVHRGMAYGALGQLEAEAADYQAALALDGRDPGVWKRLGQTLHGQQRWDEALRAFEQALTLGPQTAELWFGRASCLRKLNRAQEALQDFDRALALEPRLIAALLGRSLTLVGMRRPAEALAGLDQALALEPNSVELHTARGNALMDLRRFDDAMAEFDRVLEIAPDYARGWSNRGTVWQDMGQLDKAMADQLKAIALDPNDADARLNMAFCRLLHGDYVQGFREAEIRWSTAQGRARSRNLPQPLWLGETDLTGKTILLYPDQGFGDTLQFCRYAPLVAARGARVMLQAQPALLRLLSGLEGLAHLGDWDGSTTPPYELQCPLASLPVAFGTTLETIPPSPYLPIPQAQAQAWAQALGPRKARRIGLAWSGNRENKFNVNRIVPQEGLLAAMPPGVELYNLQVEIEPQEEAALERAGVLRPDHHIVDFADTAGLLANLDLVVSVDTSIVHLAGALGLPAWVMLAHAPDWRWGLSGEECAWYSSLRLLRQDKPADWTGALAKLKADLAAWAARAD
jgi:tetratricopeptide (TPR) repeat protein